MTFCIIKSISDILSTANVSKEENILLDGLDKSAEYIDAETGEIFGGDELMFKGITPEYENCDFATFVKVFEIK